MIRLLIFRTIVWLGLSLNRVNCVCCSNSCDILMIKMLTFRTLCEDLIIRVFTICDSLMIRMFTVQTSCDDLIIKIFTVSSVI